MKASVVSCVGLMLPVFSNQRINAAMTVWTGFHCFLALHWHGALTFITPA